MEDVQQVHCLFFIFVDLEEASLEEVLARLRHIILNSANDYNFPVET